MRLAARRAARVLAAARRRSPGRGRGDAGGPRAAESRTAADDDVPEPSPASAEMLKSMREKGILSKDEYEDIYRRQAVYEYEEREREKAPAWSQDWMVGGDLRIRFERIDRGDLRPLAGDRARRHGSAGLPRARRGHRRLPEQHRQGVRDRMRLRFRIGAERRLGENWTRRLPHRHGAGAQPHHRLRQRESRRGPQQAGGRLPELQRRRRRLLRPEGHLPRPRVPRAQPGDRAGAEDRRRQVREPVPLQGLLRGHDRLRRGHQPRGRGAPVPLRLPAGDVVDRGQHRLPDPRGGRRGRHHREHAGPLRRRSPTPTTATPSSSPTRSATHVQPTTGFRWACAAPTTTTTTFGSATPPSSRTSATAATRSCTTRSSASCPTARRIRELLLPARHAAGHIQQGVVDLYITVHAVRRAWPITPFVQYTTLLSADTEGDGWGVGIEIGTPEILQFRAMWAKLERNSTVALFTDSDLFDGFTNAKGWHVSVARKLSRPRDPAAHLLLLPGERSGPAWRSSRKDKPALFCDSASAQTLSASLRLPEDQPRPPEAHPDRPHRGVLAVLGCARPAASPSTLSGAALRRGGPASRSSRSRSRSSSRPPSRRRSSGRRSSARARRRSGCGASRGARHRSSRSSRRSRRAARRAPALAAAADVNRRAEEVKAEIRQARGRARGRNCASSRRTLGRWRTRGRGGGGAVMRGAPLAAAVARRWRSAAAIPARRSSPRSWPRSRRAASPKTSLERMKAEVDAAEARDRRARGRRSRRCVPQIEEAQRGRRGHSRPRSSARSRATRR